MSTDAKPNAAPLARIARSPAVRAAVKCALMCALGANTTHRRAKRARSCCP